MGVFGNFFCCWRISGLKVRGEKGTMGATMKHPLYTAGTAILLGLNVPVGAAVSADSQDAPAEPQQAQAVSPGRELLRVTNEMWFLLSGVADRTAADEASPRFEALVQEAQRVGEAIFDAEGQGQDLEALEMLHYHIAEALESLNDEFRSLCRADCYGSETLIRAFHQAVNAGLFDSELVVDLALPKPPLTEREARREVVRLKRLVEPDRALLELLQTVTDSRTADEVVARLLGLAERLDALQPEAELADRKFSKASARSADEAYKPIAPLLWGIRSEIVRIAGLPGYDDAAYDRFSDALDSVYAGLGDTHSLWFDEVFDASFRTDLDDALHENATTSK